jgi:peptide/nickel transport system substrate-binding protein
MSEDVVFSLNRAISEPSDFKSAVSPIAAVEAVDDHTVRITTAAPNPALPHLLSYIFIMSKRWAEQHNALLPTLYGDTMMSYAENHANGTGPFTLVSFAPVSARLLLSIALMGGDGAKPSLVGARAEPAQS